MAKLVSGISELNPFFRFPGAWSFGVFSFPKMPVGFPLKIYFKISVRLIVSKLFLEKSFLFLQILLLLAVKRLIIGSYDFNSVEWIAYWLVLFGLGLSVPSFSEGSAVPVYIPTFVAIN